MITIPGLPGRLHVVGDLNVVAPDVKLPLPEPDEAGEDVPRVDADPHVDGHLGVQALLLADSGPPASLSFID